jgi:hypothetical protein
VVTIPAARRSGCNLARTIQVENTDGDGFIETLVSERHRPVPPRNTVRAVQAPASQR